MVYTPRRMGLPVAKMEGQQVGRCVGKSGVWFLDVLSLRCPLVMWGSNKANGWMNEVLGIMLWKVCCPECDLRSEWLRQSGG